MTNIESLWFKQLTTCPRRKFMSTYPHLPGLPVSKAVIDGTTDREIKYTRN